MVLKALTYGDTPDSMAVNMLDSLLMFVKGKDNGATGIDHEDQIHEVKEKCNKNIYNKLCFSPIVQY